jgi:NADH dehydrogenase FAD-containing subunit
MAPQKTFKDKKLVIVGFSLAGLNLLLELKDVFDVTMIDKNSYFEYVCNNVGCIIDDTLIEKLSISYEDVIKAHNNKFKFLQGLVTKVNNDNSLELEQNS